MGGLVTAGGGRAMGEADGVEMRGGGEGGDGVREREGGGGGGEREGGEGSGGGDGVMVGGQTVGVMVEVEEVDVRVDGGGGVGDVVILVEASEGVGEGGVEKPKTCEVDRGVGGGKEFGGGGNGRWGRRR